jgi:hypothetical protein
MLDIYATKSQYLVSLRNVSMGLDICDA